MVKIYSLHHPITGELRYIGKTVAPKIEYRLTDHICKCTKFNTKSSNWIRGLLRDNMYPEINLIDTVEDSEWEYWEIFYISYFKFIGCNLLNHSQGGRGFKGKGRKLSAKACENIKKSCINRTRRKVRDTSNMGIKKKIPILQYDLQGNFIKEHLSAIDAYKDTGIWKESIRNCMNNRSKHAGGYIWKYK